MGFSYIDIGLIVELDSWIVTLYNSFNSIPNQSNLMTKISCSYDLN